jgi:hypothetical protein
VFIEDDFGSRYIATAMAEKEAFDCKLERLVLFRLINNPKFFEACGWPDEGVEQHLERTAEYLKTNPLRRVAYLTRWSKNFGSHHPEIYQCLIPSLLAAIRRAVKPLMVARSRREARECISSIGHGVGKFIAFVIIEDLRGVGAEWLDVWCHVGPGAAPALLLISDLPKDIERLTELRDAVNRDIALKRPFDLMDIEHNLCEMHKLIKARACGKMKRTYKTYRNDHRI